MTVATSPSVNANVAPASAPVGASLTPATVIVDVADAELLTPSLTIQVIVRFDVFGSLSFVLSYVIDSRAAL